MSNSIRLTAAQAIVKFLIAQKVESEGEITPLFSGVWAIFGHGNVAGLGEALYSEQKALPTFRAHNEQAMAHAAIAYTKSKSRKQMMACTASAGPGSTNMVTAAAVAHANRLPVLFLPGDTFSSRLPDPVLQQVEHFHDYTLSSNDCFKPVSRYFDRIHRPEQLLTALPQAMRVLTDAADCGPVTLALPQDVQTMAWDFPTQLFEEKIHRRRVFKPDTRELTDALELIRSSKKPLLIAGGGIHYAEGLNALDTFVSGFQIPCAETQAGKGALPWDHSQNMGAIGVTGSASANTMAENADLIIAVGTRLGDFTSGSRALFNEDAHILNINIAAFDAIKHNSVSLVGDATSSLIELHQGLKSEPAWQPNASWIESARKYQHAWWTQIEEACANQQRTLPSDAEVIGAVNRKASANDVALCAAGGLPGELHKLWRTRFHKGYHMEYGYSCMGYEIAGGIGAKMALPESEIFVLVGDGSYLMLNSEIATSVMLGTKLVIVVLDNGGFGCINRLQNACGSPSFNNLLKDCHSTEEGAPKVDFVAHARALGAKAEKVDSIAELEQALERAKNSEVTYVINLDTDPYITTENSGCWWDVAIAECSEETGVNEARTRYEEHKERQRNNL